jgi:hypothetical protein
MSNSLLALVVAAATLTGTPQDGEAWLREAESHLYAWPDPGVVVRFQVRTDVLQKTVDSLRKQLPPDPTPDMVKSIDALRRIEITGMLDTATGKATTVVDLPLETTDPKRREGIEQMKKGIQEMVSKSFESLPLDDPRLFGKDRKVLEATELNGKITIKVAGKKPGESRTIRLEKSRMLPESFETEASSVQLRYIEVLPGRFAPARLDIQVPGSPKSTATYTYQRVGELVFPSTVVATLGAASAKLEFLSVRVEKAGP